MNLRLIYNTERTLWVLYFIILLAMPITSFGQFDNKPFQTSVLYDTLISNTNREILFNSITLTNITNENITILVVVTPPKGWSSVTAKEIPVNLEANQNTIIPLRLSPSSSKTANWQTVHIEYRLNNSMAGATDTFRVKVREFEKFKATLLNTNTILASYQKSLSFPVYVKNMGNTQDNYIIRFSNDMLHLNERVPFSLKAGSDTVYNLNVRLSESQWDILRKEDVKVLVSASNEETMNLSQTLSKIGSVLKENPTAFLDMPLQLETGTQFQGTGNIQVYGGIRGTLRLSKNDRLALDFRSNTYSANGVVNNNIIRAEYAGKRWSATLGNMMELSDFFMDGYGAKLGYRWSGQSYISGYSMVQSRIGDSKTAGINLGYRLSETVSGGNSLGINIDNVKQLQSYSARQKFNFLFTDKGKLEIVGGAGMEHTDIVLGGNADPTQIGSTFGYSFRWTGERWAILSDVTLNSNSFPGIYKGQRTQLHEVRNIFNTSFVGVYYEYQFRQQNVYVDTTLFSNLFNIRTNNYGLRYGNTFKSSNMVWSLGQQVQEQPTDLADTRKYYFTYLNLNLSTTLFKKLTITTNSYLGYGSLDKAFGNTVLVNSNQSSIQYDRYGLSLRYDNGPYYYHEFVAYGREAEKYRRMIISPYADFSLLKKSLNIRTQFNYSNAKPNATEVLNMMASVKYANVYKGYDFNLSGILPLKQVNANPYFNASFRFKLHVPFVFIREYYNLKLILFKDKNGDGKLDAGEQPITDQTLTINNNLFVTNESGQVLLKNATKGNFKADFGYSSKVKGWIPVEGTLQTFPLSGNRTYYIPYKKSKIIQGKITVTLDENSNLTFSPGNIKITATSTTDSTAYYSTISDVDGSFYFNVPDGKYEVSLSQLAFDENFHPTQITQLANMLINDEMTLYFEIRQKKRGINIRKK